MGTQCSGCYKNDHLCNHNQAASAYVGAAGAPSVAKDDIIIKMLPQAQLNALIEWLAQAAAYGAEKNSGPWAVAAEDQAFIYGTKIQEIIDAMAIFPGSNPGWSATKDEVIYGDKFNQLMENINNLQLAADACQRCDTSCGTSVYCCN